MLLRENPEHDGQIWVDRGADDKVDLFEPCDFCNSWLKLMPAQENGWKEFGLCHPCSTRLEIESAINQAVENRPIGLDPEPLAISTNDHFSQPPRPFDPEAFGFDSMQFLSLAEVYQRYMKTSRSFRS